MNEIIAGSTDKFQDIVSRYQAYVFAIILNITRENRDSQDIAQEVFISIYRSLPSYHSGSFKAWVGKIAASRAIDWKRAQARAPSTDPGTEVESIAQNDNDISPEKFIIKLENHKHIKKLCQNLPAIYSKTINMYYFEDKSYEQIACEEGISTKTVESRLYRARAMLRERWEGD